MSAYQSRIYPQPRPMQPHYLWVNLISWDYPVISVADPDQFDTDPDPAFPFDTDPDLDPAFQFDTDPDPTAWYESGSLPF